jgi:ATP-dependent RNA helicase DHX8/PRP22
MEWYTLFELLYRDIMLGLLKRLAGRKSPSLKIIITSATLDGEKISQFFSGCPVMNIPGKLFPVEILYSTEQPVNYLESAVQTVLGNNRTNQIDTPLH